MKKTTFLFFIFTIYFNSYAINNILNVPENISKTQDSIDIYQIVKAIKNKNLSQLKKNLNENNVNSFDSSGVNLLSRAVLTKDSNVVKLLLKKGANPNLPNNTSSKSTPLMIASNYNLVEIAKYLIENGADINQQDKNGDPAIHWSAYLGKVEFTKLLLDYGAKTNLKSIHADGVMDVALKEWQDSVVNLLISYGKGNNTVDKTDRPLLEAIKKGNIKIVKKYLTKSNCNIVDEAGNTLLIIATVNGFMKIVKLLLQTGADINLMNPVGHTALNKAVGTKQNNIAKFLIKSGANVNQTDERFILPPLVAAARSNNLEIGELLLEKGANINTQNGIDKFTPIIWAALYNNIDFVKLLLKYNPDLSLKSKYEDKDIFGLVNDKNILELLYNYKK